MKKYTLAFILLILLSDAFGQDRACTLAASFGASIPVADFSGKDINQYNLSAGSANGPGYAKPGKMFELSFTYKKPEKYFGIAALYRIQTHQVDESALAEQLADQLAGSTVTVSTHNWFINSLMVGGYGQVPLVNKLSLDLRLMIGCVYIASPNWVVTVQGSSGFQMRDQRLGSAAAVGGLLGTGLKYELIRDVNLMAHVDISGAAPEFLTLRSYSTNATDYNTYRQYINTVNCSLGLGVRL